jgi:hypothetical protein
MLCSAGKLFYIKYKEKEEGWINLTGDRMSCQIDRNFAKYLVENNISLDKTKRYTEGLLYVIHFYNKAGEFIAEQIMNYFDDRYVVYDKLGEIILDNRADEKVFK